MNEHYRGFGPMTPELEAWLEARHDPKWKPKRRVVFRDRRGRFSKRI
ncbi:MAG: hypothetical protein JWO98_5303 [Frankiales bacterium]|nr:hypothetical protein [Frankiales bacterium]